MNAALFLTLTWLALPARDTAALSAKGDYSVGVFNPLRYTVAEGVELETHPLVFFVAPNLTARASLYEATSLWVAAEAGLSVPTLAMRLTQGYLFPSWDVSDDAIGWTVVPRLGLAVSGDVLGRSVWTARLDASVGVPLTKSSAAPLNAFLAPLEILFAAPLTGFCGRVGGLYDYALSERLRVRAEANLYVTGSQGDLWADGKNRGPLAKLSPIIVTAHAGLDIGVLANSRITVGLLWANYDPGETRVVQGADGYAERERVRSNNILPTLDFIYAPASSP